MGFPRQEYWSGLPFSPPGDFPDPGIKLKSPVSPAMAADSLPLRHLGKPNIKTGVLTAFWGGGYTVFPISGNDTAFT